MPLPEPRRGLVLSYGFLWRREREAGLEYGRKARPCVIVLSTRRDGDRLIISVAPITHSPPADPETAVELPPAVKRHLGMDDARSWVVLTELNQFVWPGHDLYRRLTEDRYEYGALPPGLFNMIVQRLLDVWRKGGGGLTIRT